MYDLCKQKKVSHYYFIMSDTLYMKKALCIANFDPIKNLRKLLNDGRNVASFLGSVAAGVMRSRCYSWGAPYS